MTGVARAGDLERSVANRPISMGFAVSQPRTPRREVRPTPKPVTERELRAMDALVAGVSEAERGETVRLDGTRDEIRRKLLGR